MGCCTPSRPTTTNHDEKKKLAPTKNAQAFLAKTSRLPSAEESELEKDIEFLISQDNTFRSLFNKYKILPFDDSKFLNTQLKKDQNHLKTSRMSDNGTGEALLMKSINRRTCPPELLKTHLRNLILERRILEDLSSYDETFFSRCVGLFNSKNEEIMLIHTVGNCTLEELIKVRREQGVLYEEKTLIPFMKCLAKALKLLNDSKIFHKSISPENIVANLKTESYQIIGFDRGRIVAPTHFSTEISQETSEYTAPEMSKESELFDPFKSDIYSLGKIASILNSSNNSTNQILNELIKKLCSENWENRLTITEFDNELSQHFKDEGLKPYISESEIELLKSLEEKDKNSSPEGPTNYESESDVNQHTVSVWRNRPDCFEKHMVNLLNLETFLEKEKEDDEKAAKIKDNINKELERAKERLEKEQEKNSRSIKNLLIEKDNHMRSNNLVESKNTTIRILKEIRPVNIIEIKRLYQKVEEASKSIKDKNILLLLGGTGCGKSTTTHYLAGTKFDKMEKEGRTHYQPISNDITPEIMRIRTSAHTKSETRYIDSVQIVYKDGAEKNYLSLCDTPGFFDTSGPEVDISNGKGVVEALMDTRSVRPVLFLSYQSIGNRLEGVKALTKIFLELIPNIKEYKDSINFIFTGFPENERKGLKDRFVNFYENNSNDESESFKILLNHLIKKSAKPICIDPEDDKRDEVLATLFETKPINNPSETFKTFISQTSMASISNQINKDKEFCMKSLQRGEFEVIKYKIDDMNYLRTLLDHVGQSSVEPTLFNLVKEICSNFEKEIASNLKLIEKVLRKGNQLTREELDSIMSKIKYIEKGADLLDYIRKNFENANIDVVPDPYYLSSQIGELIKERVDGLENVEFLSTLEDHIELKTKIELISSYKASEMKDYLNKLESHLKTNLMKLKVNEDFSSEDSIKSTINSLSQMKRASSVLEKAYPFLLELQEQMEASFWNGLKNYLSPLSSYWVMDFLEKEHICCLAERYSKLISLMNINNLEGAPISREKIDEKFVQLKNKIEERFRARLENISEVLKDDNMELSFQQIERPFKQLSLLRSEATLMNLTPMNYFDIFHKIKNLIQRVQDLSSELIAKLDQGDPNINYQTLADQISILNGAVWMRSLPEFIENDKHGTLDITLSKIEDMIYEHLDSLSKPLNKLSLKLESNKIEENLKQVGIIYEKVQKMKCLEKQFKSLAEKTESALTKTEKDLKCQLSEICEEYSKFSYDAGSILHDPIIVTRKLKYVESCFLNLKLVEHEAEAAKQFINDYFKNLNVHLTRVIGNDYDQLDKYGEEGVDDLIEDNNPRKLVSNIIETLEIYSYVEQLSKDKKISLQVTAEWRKKFMKELPLNLSVKLNNAITAGNLQQQTNKLQVVKACLRFDIHFQEREYQDLNANFSQMAKDDIQEFKEITQRLIEMNQHEELCTNLENIQSVQNFELGDRQIKIAKQLLGQKLTEEIEKARQMIRKLKIAEYPDFTDLVNLIQNLRKARASKNFHNDIKIDEVILDIEGQIKSIFIKYIERIIENINASNIEDAEVQIKHLENNMLNTVDNIPDGIEEEREKINKLIIKIGEKLIEKYSKFDSLKTDLPNLIYHKLSRSKNNKFKNLGELLLNQIHQLIQGELRTIDGEKSKNKQIFYFKNVQKTLKVVLPDLLIDYQSTVENKIAENENELKLINNDIDTWTNSELNDDKISKAVQEITAGHSEYSQESLLKIKKYVRERAQNLSKDINNLEKNGLQVDKSEFFNKISEIHKFSDHYKQTLMREISQSLENISQKLAILFSHWIGLVLNHLTPIGESDNNSFSDPEDETGKNSSSIIKALELTFYYAKHYKMEHIQLITPRFADQLKNLLLKFMKSTGEMTLKIEEGFKSSELLLDIHEIHFALCNFQRWMKTIKTIKDYFDNDSELLKFFEENISAEQCENYRKTQQLKMFDEHFEIVFNKIRAFCADVKLSEFLVRKAQVDREKEFKLLGQKLKVIQISNEELSSINHKFSADLKKETDTALENAKTKLSNLSSTIRRDLFIERKFDKDFCQQLDVYLHCYKTLWSLIGVEKLKAGCVEPKEINDKIDEAVERIKNSAMESINNVTEYKMHLLHLATLESYMTYKKDLFTAKINEILQEYKIITKAAGIAKLGQLLQSDSLGRMILDEKTVFGGYANTLWLDKVSKHGIDYVLANLEAEDRENNLNKELLRKRYNKFEELYKSLVEENLKPDNDLSNFLDDLKVLAGKMRVSLHGGASIYASININTLELRPALPPDPPKFSTNQYDDIPELLAKLFALWTLMKSENYFQAAGMEKQDAYLFKPHPAQIISILRILGSGDTTQTLVNNLVEIGTGQGKSVTLAIISTIFVLLGFEVSCACYSEYLSQRDFNTFKAFFEKVGVIPYISYGTFNQLCEKIINEKGDVRKIVQQLILPTNTQIQGIPKEVRPRVLLIDEVDVFFSAEFYSNTYCPVVTINHDSIKGVTDFIWKQRNDNNLTSILIKSTQEYLTLKNAFPNWVELLDEIIKDMIFDVKNFQSHDYVCHEGKVGYKDQDKISFNKVYRYQTLFANYFEFARGKVSEEELKKCCCFRIIIGSFSYAEIPHRFEYIFGVTGTLKCLSQPERLVIKGDYKINKFTFMPSVFGKSNLKFDKGPDSVMIEERDDFFNKIKSEMNKIISKERAVIIFFETEEELDKFYNEAGIDPDLKEKIKILTEKNNPGEKETIVKNASNCQQISLITKAFGRGTDFISRDDRVQNNGGVHVIQTFLSDQPSEETQIKGRTARQGQEGSFCLILSGNNLEKYHISIDELNKLTGIDRYNYIDKKRVDFFEKANEAGKDFIKKIKVEHDLTIKFFHSIQKNDHEAIRNFLISKNKGANELLRMNTIVLMDATGSMSSTLENAKNTVGQMFKRACEILKEYKIAEDIFLLKFIAYRNYSSGVNDILQISSWEAKADNLEVFLKTVKPSGGQGDEAIEIALFQVNEESKTKKINQVILIGDAPANSEESVKSKRNSKSWDNSKYGAATHYKKELINIKNNKIPIHGFYLNNWAQQNFEEIAKETGGQSKFLETQGAKGAEMLTNFITTYILKDIESNLGKGDSLSKAYAAKFGNI